ncbi:YpbF family protein [Neobacillus fumarioli]|uniref:YpbF family protein n=1 Tax=Neobacillus fumarioli TaxID=105229 RepID=UPI0008341061|nr:YpbF family protein [Neobacillus fumarioli]
MDTPIRLLENTDEATKQALDNVRKRKEKFDKFERYHKQSIWGTVLLASLFLIYLYMTVISVYPYSFAEMFSAFVNDSNNLTFLVLSVGMYGGMNVLRTKKDKAEKEYHELRCEIVDRSKDFWGSEEQWKNRHLVFEVMKKHYDINLYHEKK